MCDEREDDDPDDVDEVPVEPGELDGERVVGSELAACRRIDEREEDEDADADVRAVEAGEHEERGAEEVLVQREALVPELGELERLAGEERQAEERGGDEPDAHAAHVAALDGGEGEHHREAAHQQHEGADGREGNVVEVLRVRADDVAVAVEEEGGDERAEEQALGGQEEPHEELAVIEAGVRFERV
jgi:hypothetical protein